jgi:hypothetical protein
MERDPIRESLVARKTAIVRRACVLDKEWNLLKGELNGIRRALAALDERDGIPRQPTAEAARFPTEAVH